MKPYSTLIVAFILCGLAKSTEIGGEHKKQKEVDSEPLTRSASEDVVDTASLPAEARIASVTHVPVTRTKPIHGSQKKTHSSATYHGPATTYHQPAPGYLHHQAGVASSQQQHQPVYQSSQLGVSVSSYQPQNTGSVGILKHHKDPMGQKKTIPSIKNRKPEYYPKESSYATIPSQPKEAHHSPRFVANPSRNQIIENISPLQLQQLTMQPQPQPFAVVQHPHGVHLPHYPAPGANPYMMMPYNHQQDAEAVTVKYDETEHRFIDRVWGEVVTMRQTISDGFFEVIPAMIRELWNTIVGAVSSTTARMLGSIDWFEAFQLIVKQLN